MTWLSTTLYPLLQFEDFLISCPFELQALRALTVKEPASNGYQRDWNG